MVPVQVGTAPLFRPACVSTQFSRMAKHAPGFVLSRSKQLELLITTNYESRRKMSTSDDSRLTNKNIEAMQSIPLGNCYDTSNNTAPPNYEKLKANVDSGEGPILLASLASSPEKFANSLKITPHQVREAIQARKAASTDIHEKLTALENENKHRMSAGEIGRIKHQMICNHRHKHLRKPFVCRKCWTYLPVCVCPLFERVGADEENDTALDDVDKKEKAPLPNGVERVILWTHHEEWGRTSNTGSLLPLGLERTEMLMKGLDEHEEIMAELLSRKDLTPVVLWPGKGREDNASITIPELRNRFVESEHSVDRVICNNNSTAEGMLLISIEGTWNHARKMANKLPSNVLRLDLSEEIAANFSSPKTNGGIFYSSNYSATSPATTSPSLLAPLRRQGKGNHGQPIKMDNVSTLEATIVALLALGLSVEDASRILRIARTKVDRILEYSGKGLFLMNK